MSPKLIRRVSVFIGASIVSSFLLLAGCGGYPEDVTSGSTSSTATTASTATTPTAAVSSSTTATAPTTTAATAATTTTTGLPTAVETMRQRIRAAAAAGDFDALERLTGPDFTYVLGGSPEGGPAAFWRVLEKDGHHVLVAMVSILDMPYGRIEGDYVWPFAHALNFREITQEQRALLDEYFSAEEVRAWLENGSYLGWRAGITETGTWIFFVAGD
jgi:hypothetical protein